MFEIYITFIQYSPDCLIFLLRLIKIKMLQLNFPYCCQVWNHLSIELFSLSHITGRTTPSDNQVSKQSPVDQ